MAKKDKKKEKHGRVKEAFFAGFSAGEVVDDVEAAWTEYSEDGRTDFSEGEAEPVAAEDDDDDE